MTTLNATFTSKDENFPDGETVYWFDVSGEAYGVVLDSDGNAQVVDCDGVPSTDYNAEDFNITDEMIAG